ncbi:cytochrome P450 2K1-like [Micropterus dolomieu]|uniref:cytochrome P450 2K1-like n=1 Tax=Micropterus dolomieu TaxID=147949 RepID=UPI001E8E5BB7|nr:cytochrome P450 2K1-like [Micropterus dolomieu]
MITVLNLFAAGTDTTATTLRWGLLLMAKYPKIQDQVQEELNRVIGSRQVQVEDRKNLPFTDAVIHETQRLANIVPMALPHKTTQDVTFQGHFIKKSSSSLSLLGALLVLLLVYLKSSSGFTSQEEGKEPPGPKPLPMLGNLLQLDLKRPYNTLLELSKKYGSVFTIYMGPKKVVVLAGYKTVKEALVNHAEEFGDRDPMQVMQDTSKGNGVLWSNGDSWKEMRRFALTNLRDFGMGKKACEDKIIEECDYLIEVFKKFKGEAFDTTQPMNYAVSNIICSIVYGSRFEYDDPEFTSLVDRTNRNIQLAGSPSIQVYNMFPWICNWVSNRKEVHKLAVANIKQNLLLFSRLKETLNPQMCRGFVDAFLVRKQNLEV